MENKTKTTKKEFKFNNKILLGLFFIALFFIMVVCFRYLYANTTPVINTSIKKPLPVIMYHHVSEKESLLNKYTVSVEELESDLVYLLENGYTTISINELLTYMYDGGSLPQKPILLTFDDGHESFYHYVFPLLKKYNAKAVVSVVGSFTDAYSTNEDHNIDYSYLTWKQINEMANTPYVEIGNHTYNMHSLQNELDGRKGCDIIKGEDLDSYTKKLVEDVSRVENNILNYTSYKSSVFAYPFGIFSQETKDIIKGMGFPVILTCAELVNYIDPENDDFLYNLGRFNRDSGLTSYEFFKNILN